MNNKQYIRMRHPNFMTRMTLMGLLMAVSLSAAAQSTYIRKSYKQQGYASSNFYGTEQIREESSAGTFQLRTNALYDLALTPNVGLEYQASFGAAFQLDYVGAWWNQPSGNRFFSSYGFQTEMRYYFDHSDYSKPYRKWHAGVYGQMGTYDFEFGDEGYQCKDLDKTWGLGISGGYTLPISRRWAIDFTLGLGYFQSKYVVYDPIPYRDGWMARNTKVLKFWGPTKAEVSFVWSLNKTNK